MKAATYLHFNDNAQDVIETYKAIFGAEVMLIYTYDDDMTDDPTLLGKIFHAEMKIGDLNLYLADSGETPDFSSIKLVVEISDEEQAHRVFEQLAQDGEVVRDFKTLSIGTTIADVRDKFGILWNIVIC
ncbi:VOC family protein [bacterium]|nr:VOC family protein [bacterium]